MTNFKETISFIQEIYKSKDFIPLHTPTFGGNEKKYLNETIDTTFVSSVGAYVNQFEVKHVRCACMCASKTRFVHTLYCT